MYICYLDDMELPIAPDKIQTKINGKNKAVTLINEGEVNILKKAGLSEVRFDLRIPHYPLPFSRNSQPVKYYLNKLELLKVEQMPFQFIVYRDNLYNTNMTVSLEDYTIDEDASNGEMTIIPVQLKQYRPYGDVEAKIKTKTENGKEVYELQKKKDRLDTKKPPKEVKARQGDTLWSIAQKYLDDGTKYKQLAKINKISNPNGILAGQVIRLE